MSGHPHLDDLEARVAKMRELGVTKWGDIELGPAPGSEPSADDVTQRTAEAHAAEEERKRRLTFGASGGPRPRAVRG